MLLDHLIQVNIGFYDKYATIGFYIINQALKHNFNQMKNLSPKKSGFLTQMHSSRQSSSFSNFAFEIVDSTSHFDILYEPKYKRKLECYMMSVERKHYENFLEVHQWRSKTSLPVVKPYYIDIIEDRAQQIFLKSYNQYIPQKLQSIFNIPLIQGLYILKEGLIGFQRLFQKFGPFYPTDKMIGINQNNKCRIWLNECFNENKVNPANIKQSQFCIQILGVIRNHLFDSQTVESLWQKILEKPSFISIFKTIQKFAVENKIKIPNKFQLNIPEKPMDLSTITGSSLIYSKRSINSIASNKNKNNQNKKLQNLYSINSPISPREKHHKTKFTVLPIEIKIQQNIYKLSPQDTFISSPKTPTAKININYFEYQERKKSGTMYRSSDVNNAFLNLENPDSIPQKQRKYSQNLQPAKNYAGQKKQKKIIEKKEEKHKNLNSNFLLAKHGWEKKVEDLLSLDNVKNSIIEGNDTPISDSMIRCQKLDVFANQLVRSRFQSQYEDIPDDIYL